MWTETNKGLYQEFEFKDFDEAFRFMNDVAAVAESNNHHPRWENDYKYVRIWLSTHSQGGQITPKDRDLAEAITNIYNRYKQPSFDDNHTTPSTGLSGSQLPLAQGAGEDRKGDVRESTLTANRSQQHSDSGRSGNRVSGSAGKQAAEVRPTQIKMFADGGSRGNPGPSASGFVLLTMDDEIIYEGGLYIGITTNNQAEYHAVRLGLEEAKKRGVREIQVYLDSLLVVNQMKGIFKIKNRDLWPIHQNIKELVGDFKKVTFTHVPRELNKLADGMVNQILDNTDLSQV